MTCFNSLNPKTTWAWDAKFQASGMTWMGGGRVYGRQKKNTWNPPCNLVDIE